jgi:hypothetical protein
MCAKRRTQTNIIHSALLMAAVVAPAYATKTSATSCRPTAALPSAAVAAPCTAGTQLLLLLLHVLRVPAAAPACVLAVSSWPALALLLQAPSPGNSQPAKFQVQVCYIRRYTYILAACLL